MPVGPVPPSCRGHSAFCPKTNATESIDRVNIGHKGRDGHLYTKYFPGNIFGVAAVDHLGLTNRRHEALHLMTRVSA